MQKLQNFQELTIALTVLMLERKLMISTQFLLASRAYGVPVPLTGTITSKPKVKSLFIILSFIA